MNGGSVQQETSLPLPAPGEDELAIDKDERENTNHRWGLGENTKLAKSRIGRAAADTRRTLQTCCPTRGLDLVGLLSAGLIVLGPWKLGGPVRSHRPHAHGPRPG